MKEEKGLVLSGELQVLKNEAQVALESKMLPASIQTWQQAVTIAMKGRELGIPLMQSLSHIHVVNGKPSCSSELMLALIFKNCPTAIIDYVSSNEKVCEIQARRSKEYPPQTFKFSLDDAVRVGGLLTKQTWKSYPQAMLRARAISMMSRALFPDAISGMSYTPEELGAEVVPAEAIEDGVIVEEKVELEKPVLDDLQKQIFGCICNCQNMKDLTDLYMTLTPEEQNWARPLFTQKKIELAEAREAEKMAGAEKAFN
jgi:hypothetical protein